MQGRLAQWQTQALPVSQAEQELWPEPSRPEAPEQQHRLAPRKSQLLAELKQALPAFSPEHSAAAEFPVRFRLASICSPFQSHQAERLKSGDAEKPSHERRVCRSSPEAGASRLART